MIVSKWWVRPTLQSSKHLDSFSVYVLSPVFGVVANHSQKSSFPYLKYTVVLSTRKDS